METKSYLNSKIQYNNFEPGEFENEKKRSYEELISIIEEFPWEKQREKIKIDLTCSSVTIQDDSSTFLKLSLYYNGKFVLYFFNGRELYSKSFLSYKESYDHIKMYFKSQTVAISAFKKENIVFRNLSNHFITKDFIYQVNAGTLLKYTDRFTKFTLIIYVGLLVYLFINRFGQDDFSLGFLTILLAFPLLGGINLLLAINYFNFSKGKVLLLSKGASYFKYGNIGSPLTFKKTDIEKVIIEKNTSTKCVWNNFTISILYMKDGTIIKIPSTLLPAIDIEFKLPGIQIITDPVFIPYCK